MPRVSVVIPTYNRAQYVGDAIQSVLAQSYDNWELIIVDDGSTDSTRETVKTFTVGCQAIRYVYQENAGVSSARNTGVKHASGEYVAFLDDDDTWLPEKLSRHVSVMDQDVKAGMSYSRLKILRSQPGEPEDFRYLPDKPETSLEKLMGACYVLTSMMVVRRSTFLELGGFNEQYRSNNDWDLLLRFARDSKVVALNDVLTCVQKDERKSISKDILRSGLGGIRVLKNLWIPHKQRRLRAERRKQLAILNYTVGRRYRDHGYYWSAAKFFARAVWLSPLVGREVVHKNRRAVHPMVQIAKSYMAVPICLAKGVLHDQR